MKRKQSPRERDPFEPQPEVVGNALESTATKAPEPVNRMPELDHHYLAGALANIRSNTINALRDQITHRSEAADDIGRTIAELEQLALELNATIAFLKAYR